MAGRAAEVRARVDEVTALGVGDVDVVDRRHHYGELRLPCLNALCRPGFASSPSILNPVFGFMSQSSRYNTFERSLS